MARGRLVGSRCVALRLGLGLGLVLTIYCAEYPEPRQSHHFICCHLNRVELLRRPFAHPDGSGTHPIYPVLRLRVIALALNCRSYKYAPEPMRPSTSPLRAHTKSLDGGARGGARADDADEDDDVAEDEVEDEDEDEDEDEAKGEA